MQAKVQVRMRHSQYQAVCGLGISPLLMGSHRRSVLRVQEARKMRTWRLPGG